MQELKYFFRQTKMEYSDFWVTQDGVRSIYIFIQAIRNMNPPAS